MTGRFQRSARHVVVAGGGVAALEACLALRAHAGDRLDVTLLAPEPSFVYRPADVRDPVAARRARRAPLDRLAATAGIELAQDRLARVDAHARVAVTATGRELGYDQLVVAVGARPRPVPHGAVPVGDRRAANELRLDLAALRRGVVGSAVLVAPPAPAWRLELYELALQLAVTLRAAGRRTALTVVTAEEAPLAILGARAAAMLRHTLTAHGVRVVESAYVRAIAPGDLLLVPGGERLAADRVLAAPRLEGPYVRGLPHGADGFLPVDALGRVRGVDGVLAAGDCTAFPVKHASLAAQQADAAAGTIAGAPRPFKPVLRCMLPARLRWYVEAPIAGGAGDATRLSPVPLWPGPTRWGARQLAVYLDAELPPTAAPPRMRRSAVERVRRTMRSYGRVSAA